MPQSRENFQKLQDIIAALRSPDGCPWDRKQTSASFKSYLIEESHELVEALDDGDPELVKEELGDMFFQLLFLGRLYEEKGSFTIADSLHNIIEKMIHRHPHVFGETKVHSEEEQRRMWNKLKSSEKKKKSADLVSNVPKSMPALRRAQRVSERAAHNGFDWKDIDDIFTKINEELIELKQAISNKTPNRVQEELGDLLFAVVNIGRKTNTNTEDALKQATDKFISRFSLLEKTVQKSGQQIRNSSPEELLNLWQKCKNLNPTCK